MSGARAVLKNAPLSPQKARLVADMVRNKPVADARDLLAFDPKRASRLIARLLDSAVANAEEMAVNERWYDGDELNVDALFIKRIYVDDGIRMKRIQPRARGMAFRIIRRRCHITVEIDDRKG